MKQILYQDNKAVALPIFFIIAVIVIVAGVGYFLFLSPSAEYWETKNEFGNWQEEIIVEYADGSIQSFKILQDNNALPFSTVKYNGQEVRKLTYNVYATASGEGYTGVEIDKNNWETNIQVWRGSARLRTITNRASGTSSGNIGEQIRILNGLTTIIQPTLLKSDDVSGTYKFLYHNEGSISYRGTPNGEWKSATLPSDRSITVNFEQDSITLSINADLGASN